MTISSSPLSGLPRTFRVAALSVIKHDYVARGVASHPRFELVAVADDPSVPDWVHEGLSKEGIDFLVRDCTTGNELAQHASDADLV